MERVAALPCFQRIGGEPIRPVDRSVPDSRDRSPAVKIKGGRAIEEAVKFELDLGVAAIDARTVAGIAEIKIDEHQILRSRGIVDALTRVERK